MAYRAIEAIAGRRLTWRLGRFLYMGARREITNDPAINGEYALLDWLLEHHTVHARGSRDGAGITLIDVGANLGDWSERALSDVQRRRLGHVAIHAFEPAPDQYRHMCDRLAKGIHEGHVIVHRDAVAATPSRARFTVTGRTSGTSALAAGDAVTAADIEVAVTTLDEAAARLNLGEILLVKVDTEGNDFNVISGARKMLQAGQVLAMQFEYNWRWVNFGAHLRDVFETVKDVDYAIGRLTENGIEVHAAWDAELEHYFETNYVLIRRDVLSSLPHRRASFDEYGAIKLA